MLKTSKTCPGALLALLVFQLLASVANGEPSEILKPAGVIDLDISEAWFGPIVADPGGKRLYVLGTSRSFVAAIDVKCGKEIGRVDRGLGHPQGAAYLSGMGRLIVTNQVTAWIRVYDDNLTEVGAIRADLANGVEYDPKTKLAYVGYRDANTGIAVIDPQKARKVDEIRLDGYPEGFQLEAKGNRIFVNIPRTQQIAVIDRQKRAVVTIWPLQDQRWSFPQNFPMALDEEHHRLLVGCRKPPTLVAIDTNTGKIVSTVACCPNVGSVFYDAERKRIYASGDEYVSVFEQVDPNTYKILGFVTTGTGAVTSLFVPSTRKFYVAVPDRKLQDPKLMVFDCGTDAAPTTAPAAAAAN